MGPVPDRMGTWLERFRAARGDRAPSDLAPRRRLVVALCCVALAFTALLSTENRGLWAPDELRYAQVAQGMIETGDWFVPRLWGAVYTEKPPLYFWLVAALAPFTAGVHLSTLLGPVVVAGGLVVSLTSSWAARWYGERAGLLAALVLVSLPLFQQMSSVGRMDMLLALFVTAAIVAFYRGYAEGDPAQRFLGFVWIGCGVLAKGPFGLVFPLAVLVAALAFTRQLSRFACRETCLGLAALAVLMALWLGPATADAGPSYVQELVSRQLVQRAVAGVSHSQPAYFYLWLAPLLVLPWLVFLTPALRSSWTAWRARRDVHEIWLLCWMAAPLVVMSLVREKSAVYLLPMMPPVAVLIGRYGADLVQARGLCPRATWRIRTFFACLGTVGAVSLILSLICRPIAAHPPAVAIGSWYQIQLGGDILQLLLSPRVLMAGGAGLVALAVAGTAALRASGARGVNFTFGSLTATTACAHLFLISLIMPALDRAHSWRAVADALDAAQRSGQPVIAYGVRPFAAYYVRDNVVWFKKRDSLEEFVRREGTVWCATRPDELDDMRRQCIVETHEDWWYPTPTDPVVLVRLRPNMVAHEEGAERVR